MAPEQERENFCIAELYQIIEYSSNMRYIDKPIDRNMWIGAQNVNLVIKCQLRASYVKNKRP